MLLSIIICVYNTKPDYLAEALKSIFSSSLENFETIIVDDGSDLDYSDLISEYPIKYTKTKNNGLLDARLNGIAISSGDYICFVDSDDAVSKNYHKPMLDLAIKENCDIVINDWAFLSQSLTHYCLSDTTISEDINLSGENALLFYTSQKGREQSYFVQWNKIFKRSLILKTAEEIKRLSISEKHITYAEDAIMNFFNFKNAERIRNIHTGFYFYRIHSNQSVFAGTEKRLLDQINSMSLCFDVMRENIPSNSPHSSLILENIQEWQALMSRSHYAASKSLSLNIDALLCEKYHVKDLSYPKKSDGSAYSKTEIIGSNFDEIDSKLTELYFNENASALAEKSCKYVNRFIKSIEALRSGIGGTQKIQIPKNKVGFLNRTVYNPTFYGFKVKISKLKNKLFPKHRKDVKNDKKISGK